MATTAADDWGSRRHVHTLMLMAATVAALFLCYRMVVPFLPALAAALTLAVLFTPLQRWLESRLHQSSIAALCSVLLIGAMVVVPAVFVGQRLLVQAAQGAQLVETRVASGEWRRAIEAQPRLAPLAARIESSLNLPDLAKSAAQSLSDAAGSIVGGSLRQMVGFLLTFYLLFFFLRDRTAVLGSVRELSPLSMAQMNHLFDRVRDTIHATVYGTLAVSAVQGLLGGLMFWFLGLPAALLWGLVMALLSVIPVLGAFVVWIPAAVFLALEGHWGQALVLCAWGLLVVGTADNLLRPILVGDRLRLHTVLAFLSLVGGLLLFGATGLILGPVTLTVTLVLLEIWARPASPVTAPESLSAALGQFENEGGATGRTP